MGNDRPHEGDSIPRTTRNETISRLAPTPAVCERMRANRPSIARTPLALRRNSQIKPLAVERTTSASASEHRSSESVVRDASDSRTGGLDEQREFETRAAEGLDRHRRIGKGAVSDRRGFV
jgi:hypothetical protein